MTECIIVAKNELTHKIKKTNLLVKTVNNSIYYVLKPNKSKLKKKNCPIPTCNMYNIIC